MDSDVLSLSLDDATAVWAFVEQQLDAFCRAWDDAPPPPELASFVGDVKGPVRRLLLVDLVKIDMEYRGSLENAMLTMESYLEAWPELAADGIVPPELLYEDVFHRRRNGYAVDIRDYQARFPQSADALKRLLGETGDSLTATSLSTDARKLTEFRVGDQVDDFELRVELGRGAFGVVFLAIQSSMQRMVALKISANRGTEAQVLAQLEHPNIVRVFDRRTIQNDELQLCYMQYVRGGTLHGALQHVRSHEPHLWSGRLILEAIDQAVGAHDDMIAAPTPARLTLMESHWVRATCDLGIQLASALDYAHQKGTLHRDVKPANILLTADGSAKLADFNISCNSKVEGASPAAYFGGSLAYMSPEQLEAYNPLHDREPGSLDQRSDVYSAGVVLWEMLTGTRPFGDERFELTWDKTLHDMTARRRAGLSSEQWDSLPSHCPSALRSFFQKSLHPDPEQRFERAADAIRLLRIAGSEKKSEQAWHMALATFARRHPFVLLFLASVVPNALAAIFVFIYNRNAAFGARDNPNFWWAQLLINGIFFPLGAYLVVRFAWPLGRAIRARRHGESVPLATQVTARNRSLNLGRLVLMIGFTLWITAGVLYPTILRHHVWDFLFSHLLGGLLAGTYPFFLITYIGVTAWYPPFLETAVDDDGTEASLLATTQRACSFAEVLVAALPMLSIVALVFVTGSEKDAEIRDLHQRMLATLSVASLVGFGFLFWLTRGIRHRIQQLRSVLTVDGSNSAV